MGEAAAVAEVLARTDAEAAAVEDADGDADADADRGASDEDGACVPVPSASPSPDGSAWISDGIPGRPSSPVGAPPVCWPDRNAPETTATSSPTPTTPAPASSRRGPGVRRFVA
ncbi:MULTISPECIES: hypothetical protein [unclassified Streptomyces]|uniref:hypothetical protein n=1 Tax=Streptomyces sp. NPDC127129 TaxID=3345373 RepID=UPI00362550D9